MNKKLKILHKIQYNISKEQENLQIVLESIYNYQILLHLQKIKNNIYKMQQIYLYKKISQVKHLQPYLKHFVNVLNNNNMNYQEFIVNNYINYIKN